MNNFVGSVGRTRALLDAILAAVFGPLGLYITVRMISQRAEAFGVILIAALTAGAVVASGAAVQALPGGGRRRRVTTLQVRNGLTGA